MKNISQYIKGIFKATAVLSLAVFQVSFFMKPFNSDKIHRELANEVAVDGSIEGSGNTLIINGRTYNAEDLEDSPPAATPPMRIQDADELSENAGDEVSNIEDGEAESSDDGTFTGLIPENLPSTDDVRQALRNYQTKSNQCLVRQEDSLQMTDLIARYKRANERGSREDKAVAFTEVSEKLIALGLLDHDFGDRSNSEDSDDDQRFNLDLDSEIAPASTSAFLNKDVPAEFNQIKDCHMAELEGLSEADQKAYFDANIAPIFADELGDNMGSANATQRTANDFYTAAGQADAATGNQLGLQYGAQAHGQAAILISSKLAEITALQNQLKLNPSDQLSQTQLSTKLIELQSGLTNISASLKAQASTALAADPAALASANTNIDFAVNYWAQESVKIAQGQPITSLQASSTTQVPTVTTQNPIGIQPSIFTDLASPTANLDPSNAMLLPPTAFPNGDIVSGDVNINALRASEGIQRGQDAGPGFQQVTTRRPVRQ